MQCAICEKAFSSQATLRKHLQKIHKEDAGSIKKFFSSSSYSEFICPICEKDQGYRKDLIDHLTAIHGIVIEKETFKFSTEEEFLNWKNDIENQTKSRFTKRHGTTALKDGSQAYRFQCNRSGIYRSKSKELRRTETVKINAYCPAEMHVHKFDDYFSVSFIKNHIGHLCDFQSLPSRQITTFIKNNDNYVCPICRNGQKSKSDFHHHLIYSHNISLDPEILHFPSEEQFQEWKSNIEKFCRLKFVKRPSKKTKDGYKQPYFCNFSKLHYFRQRLNKTKRKRPNKAFRMDVTCPAEIVVEIKEGTQTYDVRFIGTHIGHPVGEENDKSYTENPKKSYICSLCFDPVLPKEQYHIHLEQFHNILVECQKINFTSQELLNDWKKSVEEIGGCRFVLKRSTYVNKEYEHTHYYCNQSEIIAKKCTKEKSSNLFFPLCPAEFVVRKEKDSVNVEFVSTHVGHTHKMDINTAKVAEDTTCDDMLVDNNSIQLSEAETASSCHVIDFDIFPGSVQVNTEIKSAVPSICAVAESERNSPLNIYSCPICEICVISKQQLSDHLFLEHDVKLETENLSFVSEVEFNIWKSTMEKLSNSTYVLKESQYCNDNKVLFSKYRCNEELKSKADTSLKICPAEIIVQKYENTYNVEFVRTHVGHLSSSNSLQITEVKSLGLMEEIGINLTKYNDTIQTEEIQTSADYFLIVARVPRKPV